MTASEPRCFRYHLVGLKVEFYKKHLKMPKKVVLTRFHIPAVITMLEELSSKKLPPPIQQAVAWLSNLAVKPSRHSVRMPCTLFGCSVVIRPEFKDVIEFF